jgi:eukaryotic-like serine/threonine-protein kinase
MPIAPGARLGAYEVLSAIGAGGMGEVYRARDMKLNRDVALKLLPEIFASDPERLQRFQREAQVLASLNHPNIAAIYGLEGEVGREGREGQERREGQEGLASAPCAIVMELIEGPTLAEVIHGHTGAESGQSPQGVAPSEREARQAAGVGPRGIPINEALPIARQLAEALEAAHEKGIIHRDLKPANIKVRDDGSVKVLDFGLAKLLDAEAAPAGQPRTYSPSVTNSPTITTPAMTQLGVILGTAAYMSPEQAKGKPADKRSDIWAFGCVLFEMLTGKRAFEGEDVSDTLALVLRGEPDWTALPTDIPQSLSALIRQCLQKDRRQRVGDIAAALFVLQQASTSAPSNDIARLPARSSRYSLSLVASGLAVAALAAALTSLVWWRVRPSLPHTAVTRFSISLPEDQRLASSNVVVLAISPDGTKVVYLANRALYLRTLTSLEAKPISISGIEAAGNPVFSPDSESIVFYSPRDQKLRKVSVTGGAAVTLCDAVPPNGISWGASGIVFGQRDKGIVRVSASGGQPEMLATVQPPEQAAAPEILPDGDSLLFTLSSNEGRERWDTARIVVQSLRSGERRTLIEGGSDAHYVSTGHLVYFIEGVLFARPFDVRRLLVTGGPMPVVEGIRRGFGNVTVATAAVLFPAAQFSFSANGSLIYVPGPASLSSLQQELVLADRTGASTKLKAAPGPYQHPRVSPDGKRIVFETNDGKDANVWILDVAGGSSPRRLTFAGKNRFPIWSRDGQWVAFQSDREGDLGIFRQRVDGTQGTLERLTTAPPETSHAPESWSPTTDLLTYSITKGRDVSVGVLSLNDRKTTAFSGIETTTTWPNATFSPDGRWLAYSSRPLGQTKNTIYVEPFPQTGVKYQITTVDGHFPAWSPDGGELFFLDPSRPANGRVGFVAVKINSRPDLTVGDAIQIPRAFYVTAPGIGRSRTYDVMPDGRFLGVMEEVLSQADAAVGAQMQVVLNWFEELKQRVPVN